MFALLRPKYRGLGSWAVLLMKHEESADRGEELKKQNLNYSPKAQVPYM